MEGYVLQLTAHRGEGFVLCSCCSCLVMWCWSPLCGNHPSLHLWDDGQLQAEYLLPLSPEFVVYLLADPLCVCVCVQTPSILSWAAQDAAHNIYNTPNIFAIWGVEQITADLLQKGGLEAAGARSRRRAQQVGGCGVSLGCVWLVGQAFTTNICSSLHLGMMV